MRRRRTAIAYRYEVASGAAMRPVLHWNDEVAMSCQALITGPQDNVGMPQRVRQSLQQAFHDRGSRGVVLLAAAMLRVFGSMLMELGTMMEIFLAERLRAETPVGAPLPRPDWHAAVREGEDEQEEEEGGDETQLMQRERQPGTLRACEVEDLSNELWSELLAKYNWTPRKSKHMLFVVGAMVRRNMASRLPSMRQACQGLQRVLDSFAERVMHIQLEKDDEAAAWARAFWRGVRGKCRGAVARQKRRVRAEERRAALERRAQQEQALVTAGESEDEAMGEGHDLAPRMEERQVEENMPVIELDEEGALADPQTEEDEVFLMQGSLNWVRFLQDDLEYCKARGEGVGAYVAQLQSLLLQDQHDDVEALACVQALRAAYQEEPCDEARPDRADTFARKWVARLRTLLRQPGVTVVDTQQTTVDDQAGVLEQVQQEASDRRLKRVRIAQAEDDKALQLAMEESCRGSGSASSRGPLEGTCDILVKRCLINGVEVPMGGIATVTGGRFELAVQMDVAARSSGCTGTSMMPGDQSMKGVPNEGYTRDGKEKEAASGGSAPSQLHLPATTSISTTTLTTPMRQRDEGQGREGQDGLDQVNCEGLGSEREGRVRSLNHEGMLFCVGDAL